MNIGPYRVMPLNMCPASMSVIPPRGVKDVTRRPSTNLRAGDIAYIRERWAADSTLDELRPTAISTDCPIWYDVDGVTSWPWVMTHGKGRPPMFMLPWMSRKTALIVDVRRERLLGNISTRDAFREGIIMHGEACGFTRPENPTLFRYALDAYSDWWDSFARKSGTRWADNPLVYRIEFKTICRNWRWVLDRLQAGKTWDQVEEEANDG